MAITRALCVPPTSNAKRRSMPLRHAKKFNLVKTGFLKNPDHFLPRATAPVPQTSYSRAARASEPRTASHEIDATGCPCHKEEAQQQTASACVEPQSNRDLELHARPRAGHAQVIKHQQRQPYGPVLEADARRGRV